MGIRAGKFRGSGRRPAGQRAGVAISRTDGKHVGHGIEVTPMMKPALLQFEALFIGGEADTGCGPRRQSQHGDPGHPLLAGHRLPRFRGSGVVVDNDPVRPRLGAPQLTVNHLGICHLGICSSGSRAHTGRRQPRPPALAVQFGVQRILEFGGRGEHQSPHTARIEHLVMMVVRQPDQPRPVFRVARDDHELDISRTVIHRQCAQNRPHHGVQFIAIFTDKAETGL